nr:hypothetical protein [Microctonus hyperodae filamentous virus]
MYYIHEHDHMLVATCFNNDLGLRQLPRARPGLVLPRIENFHPLCMTFDPAENERTGMLT